MNIPPNISAQEKVIIIDVLNSLSVHESHTLASAQKTGKASAENASCVLSESINSRAKVMVSTTPQRPHKKNNANV